LGKIVGQEGIEKRKDRRATLGTVKHHGAVVKPLFSTWQRSFPEQEKSGDRRSDEIPSSRAKIKKMLSLVSVLIPVAIW